MSLLVIDAGPRGAESERALAVLLESIERELPDVFVLLATVAPPSEPAPHARHDWVSLPDSLTTSAWCELLEVYARQFCFSGTIVLSEGLPNWLVGADSSSLGKCMLVTPHEVQEPEFLRALLGPLRQRLPVNIWGDQSLTVASVAETCQRRNEASDVVVYWRGVTGQRFYEVIQTLLERASWDIVVQLSFSEVISRGHTAQLLRALESLTQRRVSLRLVAEVALASRIGAGIQRGFAGLARVRRALEHRWT